MRNLPTLSTSHLAFSRPDIDFNLDLTFITAGLKGTSSSLKQAGSKVFPYWQS
jgi:hypothetical protein